jgi:hypothetical protein
MPPNDVFDHGHLPAGKLKGREHSYNTSYQIQDIIIHPHSAKIDFDRVRPGIDAQWCSDDLRSVLGM